MCAICMGSFHTLNLSFLFIYEVEFVFVGQVWRLSAGPAGIDGVLPEGSETRQYHNPTYPQQLPEKVLLSVHASTPDWLQVSPTSVPHYCMEDCMYVTIVLYHQSDSSAWVTFLNVINLCV